MSTSEHSVKTSRFQGISYDACPDRQVRLSSTPRAKSRSASAIKEKDTENSVDVGLSYSIETHALSGKRGFQIEIDKSIITFHYIDYDYHGRVFETSLLVWNGR